MNSKKYAESLIALCKGKTHAQIDVCAKEFLNHLANRGKSRLAQSILESLRDCAARHEGINRVTITSAYELSDQEQELFEKMARESYGKKCTVTYDTNPSLIGGFRIKVGDSVVDASVSGQLFSLKNHLKQNAFSS